MNICFFIKHEITWGSSRERVGVYLQSLKKRNHAYRIISIIPDKLSRIGLGKRVNNPRIIRAIYSLWYSKILRYSKFIYLITIAKKFDLIVIQKVNIPFFLLKWLKAINKNIIFDFDDLCFLHEELKDIGLIARLKLQWRHWYQDPKVLTLFKHVIAGNKYLAKIAQDAGQKNVSIIATSVDCNIYFPAVKKPDPTLVIGFTGAGENHLRHLSLLTGTLAKIGKKHRFIFRLIGAMHSDKIKALFFSSSFVFDCIDWMSAEQLPLAIRSFDIGVMPLIDDAEARCKCGFKALLYMASGVATVVSPVGVNREIIQDGVNGLWAQNDNEWIEKLSLLIEDKALRHNLGLEGRKTVEDRYSLVKTSELFINTLETAAGA